MVSITLDKNSKNLSFEYCAKRKKKKNLRDVKKTVIPRITKISSHCSIIEFFCSMYMNVIQNKTFTSNTFVVFLFVCSVGGIEVDEYRRNHSYQKQFRGNTLI